MIPCIYNISHKRNHKNRNKSPKLLGKTCRYQMNKKESKPSSPSLYVSSPYSPVATSSSVPHRYRYPAQAPVLAAKHYTSAQTSNTPPAEDYSPSVRDYTAAAGRSMRFDLRLESFRRWLTFLPLRGVGGCRGALGLRLLEWRLRRWGGKRRDCG